jgi:hypothetical protein
MPYTGRGKTPDELLADYEQGLLDATFKGSTTDYLHAAIAVAVANAQRRWAKIVGVAACTSALAAIAAVVVAALVK